MRIAFFSPLPPLRSGIADYSDALLPRLARYADIDVFVEEASALSAGRPGSLTVRHWREFESEYRLGRYDTVLYHIGNNPQHVYVYDMALRVPGLLVLHEFNLHYLLAEVTIVRGDWDGYLNEVEYNAGPAARAHAERARRGETSPEYDRVAMNRRLLENSLGAIVHSDYMVSLVRQAGHNLPLARIPHGVDTPRLSYEQARLELGFDHQPVAGAFGFLKPYKRIHSSIRALAQLRRDFPAAQLLLGGEEHPHYPLRPLISELGLDDRVRMLGFLPLSDFTRYMVACDACLNLRYPTVGESSGSLMRELAAGRPVLVSDLGSFSELPEEACIKLPPGDSEVDWVVEYLRALWNAPDLANAVGERARAWVASECNWERVAGMYFRFLQAHSISPAGSVRPPVDGPCSGEGLDPARVRDYILSFCPPGRAGQDYVVVHLDRLVRTLQITPPASSLEDSVLEMGCYMQITPALRTLLGYAQVRGCYYGPPGTTDHKEEVSTRGEVFECDVDLFDAEKDAYPYRDGAFDTILCCELIEHLYHDPMHMMAEVNRVLKPGGHVVLTTPNITGVRAMHALLHGYHPGLFHTYVVPRNGEVDPRHNREYAPRDIRALLENAGFEVVRLETGWYSSNDAERYADTERWMASVGSSLELRGDLIYAVGRKTGPVRERYPVELYTAF